MRFGKTKLRITQIPSRLQPPSDSSKQNSSHPLSFSLSVFFLCDLSPPLVSFRWACHFALDKLHCLREKGKTFELVRKEGNKIDSNAELAVTNARGIFFCLYPSPFLSVSHDSSLLLLLHFLSSRSHPPVGSFDPCKGYDDTIKVVWREEEPGVKGKKMERGQLIPQEEREKVS